MSRWQRFGAALEPEQLDLIGTEDVVSALIDRSMLQEALDQGETLLADQLVVLDRADRAYKAAAPALLDGTDVSLFKDDEPPTHWWWHIEELVLGQASNLLLNVPQAAESKGVHPHTIRSAIKAGALPARRLARGFLVQRRDLERWQPRRVGRPKGIRVPTGDALLDSFNAANTSGDFERAGVIARAIERDPATTRRRLALALDAYNHGDADLALGWTEQALSGALPGRSRQTALLVKGRALLVLGRARDARQVLESALTLGHIDPLVGSALADAYLALGKSRRAVEVMRVARDQAPDVPDMAYLLARVEWHDNQVWASLEHVIEFRAARPQDEEGILLHAALLGLIGDRTSDVTCYRRVIELIGELRTKGGDALASLGTAEARLGHTSKAIAALRHLRREHGDEEAHLHGVSQIAIAIVASLPVDHSRRTEILGTVELLVGSDAFTMAARALPHATAGDVEGTCSALGVPLADAETLSPEGQMMVAMALIESDRAPEAAHLLRFVAMTAEDPDVIHMAVKGALRAEDIETVRQGLQRLSQREDLPGQVARTALALFEQGERAGAQAMMLSVAATFEPTDLVPQMAGQNMSLRAADSPWEGLHRTSSPKVDDLLRAALN